jgi:hypothetical protein
MIERIRDYIENGIKPKLIERFFHENYVPNISIIDFFFFSQRLILGVGNVSLLLCKRQANIVTKVTKDITKYR